MIRGWQVLYLLQYGIDLGRGAHDMPDLDHFHEDFPAAVILHVQASGHDRVDLNP